MVADRASHAREWDRRRRRVGLEAAARAVGDHCEHVLFAHAAAGSAALDRREVDAVFGGEALDDGRVEVIAALGHGVRRLGLDRVERRGRNLM